MRTFLRDKTRVVLSAVKAWRVMPLLLFILGLPPWAVFAGPDSKNPNDLESLKKQIQLILKMNEAVKVKNKAQALEVQKIVEQARIDQAILGTLETPDQTEVFKTDRTAELLRQEKIRLIREQSLQNFNTLQNINPLPVVSKPLPEESAGSNGA